MLLVGDGATALDRSSPRALTGAATGVQRPSPRASVSMCTWYRRGVL